MSLTYGEPKFENLLYSDRIRESAYIKVNLKKNQRKFNEDLRLFAAELMFLLLYIKPEEIKINRIIYIGAAPGFHLVKLMKMFPDLKFDLYDDQELHEELLKYISENGDQVIRYREKFTVDTCERYDDKSDNLYLITDHRDHELMKDPIFTGVEDVTTAKEKFHRIKEESYMQDMELQKEVCKRLQPLVAFLRFRPPHFIDGVSVEPATFEYFKGIATLMIYNDYKSNEGRLIVTDFTNDKFAWNYKSYQHRLNHFNDEIRESMLLNPFTNDQTPLKNQLGNKFETVMLIFLLKKYFELQNHCNVKSDSILSFYTNFVIAESCSGLKGMFQICDVNTEQINGEFEEGLDKLEGEGNIYDDDIRVVEDDMMY